MDRRNKGFTLIEVLLTVSIITFLAFIVFPINSGIYDKLLLKSTAKEIRSALYLAQQLSIDESREYRIVFFENSFQIRESKFGGKVVYSQKINDRINLIKGPGCYDSVEYNRNGVTPYAKFLLSNKKGEKIAIDVLIGTGRVRISSVY